MVSRASRRGSQTFAPHNAMRIIAGRWKGRRIDAPKGDAVRPTLDRVREAWMSIVHGDLPEARVLDLFSGSGALGLEALSRGAATTDFVENAPRSLEVLYDNIAHLGAGEAAVVHKANAITFVRGLAEGAYDVAFADPPYESRGAEELAEAWRVTPFAAILGIEHSSRISLEGAEERKYGDIRVSFFRAP
ncbi:MAG: hypothetical protein JWO05_1973 [Gemmatimonadetes bacterium]|nr:hypothetical protein [Gemmatimonadota bacterium]